MAQEAFQLETAGIEAEMSGEERLCSVLAGVDFGIAIFDLNLNLVSASEQYYLMCDYDQEEFPVGTPLRDMIEHSLKRADMDTVDIEAAISTTLLRLQVGGTQRFLFRTVGDRTIQVTRCRNEKGQLVEIVQEHSQSESDGPVANRLRRMAETAHTRMMHALNAMSDGFALYDSSDRLIFYNQKFVELNSDIADLIKPGASFEMLLKNGVMREIYKTPGMTPQTFIHWRLQQHFNPGEAQEQELADGRWIRTLEQSTKDGGTVGIQTDITEIKKREQEIVRISGALDTTNDQLNVALNNMVQGLCMFDSDQKLIVCNDQYLEMYGFSPDVVKPGISISDVMRYSISLGNYRDQEAQAALRARHDPTRLKKRTTIKQHLRDGRVIAVMNEPMANGGSIATYQDITELERHEAKLVAYMRKLEISNRELQDFAYVASHDLQEPLRKIEAFGDRLASKYGDRIPDDGKMFIDRMQNASTRMRQLINDLLSYSRVTTKARPFVAVDMNDIFEGVVADLQIAIQETGAEVHFENLPTLDADQIQMRQLFQNILSNSLKYRKPDVAPQISVTAEKFVCNDQTGQPLDHWRINVADNGIGFDNKYKEQIFKIFQRLHGRMAYEGTGIGLATCRKIVERHNGRIDANGESDVGSTFTVELPAEQTNPEDESE